jgi:hypothetical protein
LFSRAVLLLVLFAASACTLNPDGSISIDGCGASTCAGCCQDGVCQNGDQPDACGVSGNTCSDCRLDRRTCLPSRDCGINGTTKLRVFVSSVRIAANDNGEAWDGDGSPPDVRISLQCPTQPASTAVQPERQSYLPTWTSGGCTASAADFLARQTSFTLDDVDAVVDDSMTAYLALPLTEDLIGSAEAYGMAEFELGASGGMLGATVRVEVVP